jgi:hypothetical protein
LPEVPSAKEVANEGLDLGDNQALLLKKIEELTLYIIEHQQQLKELKKAFEQFKSNTQYNNKQKGRALFATVS